MNPLNLPNRLVAAALRLRLIALAALASTRAAMIVPPSWLMAPVALRTRVTPDLQWTPGDYQPSLGRAYTDADFWQWASSMGQPKPGPWVGNQGVPGDVVLAARWRFSDLWPSLRARHLRLAAQAMATLPTGRPPDPEEVVSAGTTVWDLHSQGELGLHLSADQGFGGPLSRLTLGAGLRHTTFWLACYGTFANITATFLSAAWAAGRMMPIAGQGQVGTPPQEAIVRALLISLSVAMVLVCLLVLAGLRQGGARVAGSQ